MTVTEWIWVGGWVIVALAAVVLGLRFYFSDPYPDMDLVFGVAFGVIAGACWPLIAAIGVPYFALTSLHRRVHAQTRIPSRDLRRMDD